MVIPLWGYLAILTALGLERLYELRVSVRNARRAFAEGAVELGRAHYPAMVVFHALFFVAAATEAIVLKRPFAGALGWAAAGALVAAQALRLWVRAALGERWNTRIIVFPGRPPVTAGPYRFVRHPNYVAAIVEIAAVPLIRGCWLTALFFSAGNAVLLAIRIRAEERALGPGYAQEFRATPRLIPHLRDRLRRG